MGEKQYPLNSICKTYNNISRGCFGFGLFFTTISIFCKFLIQCWILSSIFLVLRICLLILFMHQHSKIKEFQECIRNCAALVFLKRFWLNAFICVCKIVELAGRCFYLGFFIKNPDKNPKKNTTSLTKILRKTPVCLWMSQSSTNYRLCKFTDL